jgi:hypothetical protein
MTASNPKPSAPVADVTASAKPKRPARSKQAPKVASNAANAAPAAVPQPSPEVQLLSFIPGTTALLDETIEKALSMNLNPAVVAQFTRASKALHGGVLMLLGTP